MPFNRREISESTNFDAGDLFEAEEQVMEYFTVSTMEDLGLGGYPNYANGYNQSVDGDRYLTQDELDEMAETVMQNRWHCSEGFRTA